MKFAATVIAAAVLSLAPAVTVAAGMADVHAAAAKGDVTTLMGLLSRSPQLLAARTPTGDTPLHAAARRLQAETLRALVAAGADLNARNADGQTPLHVLGADVRDAAWDDPATVTRYEELRDYLTRSGADPGLVDRFGVSAGAAREPLEPRLPPGYRTLAEIEQILQTRAGQYPHLCRYVVLGYSVQGRPIMALRITDNPALDEDEPEFKYVSTMHGDEIVGNELCLFFIDHLLQNYGIDPRVTNIVDNIDTWIVPVMNPDGFVAGTRGNARGVDLNRNFPEGAPPNPQPNTTAGREPETAAIMNWTWANSFTCSANFHCGALVVNYTYDNDAVGSTPAPTPDDDLFLWMSERYAVHNPPMWNSGSFFRGVTNGAAWYSITGGMQDWNYRYEGCHDVTIEVSTAKQPAYSTIPTLWNNNREAMLAYLETALIGLRGIVTHHATGQPLDATVRVVGRGYDVYTDPDVGNYHRLLLPGSYRIQVAAPNLDTVTCPVTVAAGPATRLDVALGPPSRLLYPNGGEQLPALAPVTITWTGHPGRPFQVQYTRNYGQTATVSDGFEGGAFGPDYWTGGRAAWIITTDAAYAGTRSARAGTVTHNESTWLTRTAHGGPLSFWYRVSSEANNDFFNFYVDDVRVLRRSGTVNWTLYSTTLSPGPHILKWEYVKDGSVNSGQDTVWIDELNLTVDATQWVDLGGPTPPGATARSWTPTETGTACKVRVQAVYPDGGRGAWDESDAVFTVTPAPYQLGDLNCDGAVNAFDIDPFVLALTNPAGYAAQYPNCNLYLADCNRDGQVNAFDIDAFVALIVP